MSEPLLSDAELSERIARFLEPEALPQFISARNEMNALASLNRKCWTVINDGPDGSSGRYKYVPKPRDINDPAMTVLLMEKLIGEMGLIEIGGFTDTTGAHGFSIRKHWAKNVYACNRHIGKAVALAFAKANGIAQ